jgi:hypothetical protein
MYPKVERPPGAVAVRERRPPVGAQTATSPPPAEEDCPGEHTSSTAGENPCDPVDPSLSDLWSSWPGRVYAHAAE